MSFNFRVKEKTLMLGGYIVLFISVAALLPWGNEYPPVQIASNKYSLALIDTRS